MIAAPSVQQALCMAIEDEYKAHATFRAAIDRFGPVPPFPAILRSEEHHIRMLLGLFAGRHLEPPSDLHFGRLPPPSSIEAACRHGIEAETENASLYGRLIGMAADDEEVCWVFRALQRASATCHLLAFRRRLTGETSYRCGKPHHRHNVACCCGGGCGNDRQQY